MAAKITDFKQYIKDNTIIDSNGCWIWQKCLSSGGYGVAASNLKKGSESAHRVSYRVFTGIIRKGLFVIHSCDVPACCNPAHLRTGTPQDNMDDKSNRNRCVSNPKKHRETFFKKYGWVVTPKGKFKNLREAGNVFNITAGALYYRIKSPKFPNYYRERHNESKNTENN